MSVYFKLPKAAPTDRGFRTRLMLDLFRSMRFDRTAIIGIINRTLEMLARNGLVKLVLPPHEDFLEIKVFQPKDPFKWPTNITPETVKESFKTVLLQPIEFGIPARIHARWITHDDIDIDDCDLEEILEFQFANIIVEEFRRRLGRRDRLKYWYVKPNSVDIIGASFENDILTITFKLTVYAEV